jgi:hypothetical protein
MKDLLLVASVLCGLLPVLQDLWKFRYIRADGGKEFLICYQYESH